MAEYLVIIPPAGVSEAGTWTPGGLTAPPPPKGYLADKVDPATGEWLSVSAGIHPIDAKVLFQLRAARGIGEALDDTGTELDKIRKLGDDADALISTTLMDALRPMIRAGEIGEVKVYTSTDAQALGASDLAAALVAYKNLATGKKEKAEVL